MKRMAIYCALIAPVFILSGCVPEETMSTSDTLLDLRLNVPTFGDLTSRYDHHHRFDSAAASVTNSEGLIIQTNR